ncbi:MAG: PD-(D/E)XK nuclease family protein [Hyphomicrobiales bacterium]
MKAFLEIIADHLINNYKDNLQNIAVILPTRRAGVFLKKHLAANINNPIWAPSIISIEDFATELTGLNKIDPLILPFELYQVHCDIAKEKKQNLEEFLSWGELLLRDINELDQYLVDIPDIFGYLSDTRALEEWNTDGSPLTDFQKDYLEFFNSLKDYYTLLKQKLEAKGQVWMGHIYRTLAENIKDLAPKMKWEKVIFAGFNALTNAESTFMRYLLRENKAEVLWDADEYYYYKNGIGNNEIEAGMFLRRFKKQWKLSEITFLGEYYKTQDKNINIIGVPRNIGQTKYVAELLKQHAVNIQEQSQTAIVLARENLLISLVNSMPEHIDEYNITMGFPLTQIPMFDLFHSILTMHLNKERFSFQRNKAGRFYIKDFISIIKHPTSVRIGTNNSDDEEEREHSSQNVFDQLTTELNQSNQVFLPASLLLSKINDNFTETQRNFIEIILGDWSYSSLEALNKLKKLCQLIFKEIETQNPSPEERTLFNEYLYTLFQVFDRIQQALTEYKTITSLKSIAKIFRQLSKSNTLPFYGEPLKGIQVMGMLETRALDFKNVFMLSVNEDVLPAGKAHNSFIPDDIKLIFGLPTYKEKNAVYAYHFYRFLQRAENIFLLYNTETEILGGGHKSRFINQLQLELPRYNPNVKINDYILNIPLNHKHDIENDIIIEKNQSVCDELIKKSQKGFSPSSLNRYIQCPLQFYLYDIMDLSTEEEASETIDVATLGTVVHGVLEDFYKPYIHKNITTQDIQTFFKKIEETTIRWFRKEYYGGDIKFGRNKLITEVAQRFIYNFLQYEKNFASKNTDYRINELEIRLSNEIYIPSIDKNVTIKGFADRIDSIGNITRIIDYKTGQVDDKDLKFESFDQLIEQPKYAKCFQLLVYAWLYTKTHDVYVTSGIFSFRNLKRGLLTAKKGKIRGRSFLDSFKHEDLKEFESTIIILIEEIMNPEIPFTQATEKKSCDYCPYKQICNK